MFIAETPKVLYRRKYNVGTVLFFYNYVPLLHISFITFFFLKKSVDYYICTQYICMAILNLHILKTCCWHRRLLQTYNFCKNELNNRYWQRCFHTLWMITLNIATSCRWKMLCNRRSSSWSYPFKLTKTKVISFQVLIK